MLGQPASSAPAPAPDAGPRGAPSRVLCLEGMVTQAELADDDEYRDIVADISEECSKYGALQLKVPRAAQPGCGRVFLHYAELASAVRAAAELHNKRFGEGRVQCRFFEEGAFEEGKLDG